MLLICVDNVTRNSTIWMNMEQTNLKIMGVQNLYVGTCLLLGVNLLIMLWNIIILKKYRERVEMEWKLFLEKANDITKDKSKIEETLTCGTSYKRRAIYFESPIQEYATPEKPRCMSHQTLTEFQRTQFNSTIPRYAVPRGIVPPLQTQPNHEIPIYAVPIRVERTNEQQTDI